MKPVPRPVRAPAETRSSVEQSQALALAAAKAGLEQYDIIVGVGNSDDASPSGIRAALKDKEPGDTLVLLTTEAHGDDLRGWAARWNSGVPA